MNELTKLISTANSLIRPLATLLAGFATCWILLAMIMAWTPLIPNYIHLPKGDIAWTMAGLAGILYALK